VGRNDYSKFTQDDGAAGNALLTATLFDIEPARAIAAYTSNVCFVSCTSGKTKCAGTGTLGQLGDGQVQDSTDALVEVTGLESDVCDLIK
jgi:hypothetical protein